MQGLTDYNSLVECVVTYAQHVRHEGAYKRGDNDMVVDSLYKSGKGTQPNSYEWADCSSKELGAFHEGLTCGLCNPDGEDPTPPAPEDRSLDAMYRKGKGKGKGQSRVWTTKGPGKGKGRDSSTGGSGGGARTEREKGKGKGEEKRFCSFCHIQGHLERDCQDKARGGTRKPGPTPRPANSLEQAAGDWTSEEPPMQGSILRGVDALERGCGCIDRSCAVLQRDEFGLDAAEFGAQADFAVEEAFADPTGYVQYTVSPIVDQNQWPTYVPSGSAPVINVSADQKIRNTMENIGKKGRFQNSPLRE